MSDFIPAGVSYRCPACGQISSFVRGIDRESLPVSVYCPTPGCTHAISFSVDEPPPVIPKIPPNNHGNGIWRVVMQQGETGRFFKKNPNLSQVSFRERAESIAGHLANGLQTIESLRFDLSELANAMTAQLESEWAMHTSILKYWKPTECEMFLRQPLLSLPLPSEDVTISERSRLLLQPNFVNVCAGAAVRSHGAWYAQVILPYFQYHSALDPWIAGICEIPPPWELKLRGRNLEGRDLTFHWKEIPGLMERLGHTEEEPFVCLPDDPEATWEVRRFLASKAVPPWTSVPISKQDAFPALERFMSAQGKKWQEAYQLFKTHGRLALLWDREQAWQFALNISAFCYGHKLGLIADHPQGEHLRTLLTEEASDMTTAKNFHWKVFSGVEDLTKSSLGLYWLIIVDYEKLSDPSILQVLQGYEGRVILIHSDPIMDAAAENWEASRFYSTVNCVHQYKTLPPERASEGELKLIGSWLRELKAGKR